jgi:hypothetical protein
MMRQMQEVESGPRRLSRDPAYQERGLEKTRWGDRRLDHVRDIRDKEWEQNVEIHMKRRQKQELEDNLRQLEQELAHQKRKIELSRWEERDRVDRVQPRRSSLVPSGPRDYGYRDTGRRMSMYR